MITQVNLEDFMIEASKKSGLHISSFHRAIRVINERRGRTLYKEIKNNEMPMEHFVMLLKWFGA